MIVSVMSSLLIVVSTVDGGYDRAVASGYSYWCSGLYSASDDFVVPVQL